LKYGLDAARQLFRWQGNCGSGAAVFHNEALMTASSELENRVGRVAAIPKLSFLFPIT